MGFDWWNLLVLWKVSPWKTNSINILDIRQNVQQTHLLIRGEHWFHQMHLKICFFLLHHAITITLIFTKDCLLFRSFFSCSFFLFSGFARNHFMTWVNGHSYADQWTECKIFMCWFHILIAGVASSDHGNQRTDGPVFMCFHENASLMIGLFRIILHPFR